MKEMLKENREAILNELIKGCAIVLEGKGSTDYTVIVPGKKEEYFTIKYENIRNCEASPDADAAVREWAERLVDGDIFLAEFFEN